MNFWESNVILASWNKSKALKHLSVFIEMLLSNTLAYFVAHSYFNKVNSFVHSYTQNCLQYQTAPYSSRKEKMQSLKEKNDRVREEKQKIKEQKEAERLEKEKLKNEQKEENGEKKENGEGKQVEDLHRLYCWSPKCIDFWVMLHCGIEKGSDFIPFHSHNAALSDNQCHDNALLGINNMAFTHQLHESCLIFLNCFYTDHIYVRIT